MHQRIRPALAAVLAVTLIGVLGVLVGVGILGPCAERPDDPTCVALGNNGVAQSGGAGPSDAGILGPDGELASIEPMPSSIAEPSAASASAGGSGLPLSGYTFDDEFDGTSLASHWGRHWGSLGVSELSRTQTTVGDGVLSIAAVNGPGGWTSDLVDSFDAFRQQYGYFEARMSIPEGRGLWPAFWLADDWAATPAEFDIAEICANPPGTNRGNDVTVVHQIIHGATIYLIGHKAFRTGNLSLGWHTYGLEWRPDHVSFFFDGVETWRYTNAALIPKMPMAIILSLELGTWCGQPDSTTPSPSVMQVDWVRARA